MKEWIRDILIAVVVAVIVMQFIKPTIVKEHSMEPTLYENNYIFLSKQQYRFGELRRGDIVVFHTSMETNNGGEKLLIKRVIGMQGDVISIRDGVVIRNGEALEEEYTLNNHTAGEMEEVTVPEEKIFVMGDNRQNSMDSRDEQVGFVETKDIIGKAFFRVFPFNKFGFLK